MLTRLFATTALLGVFLLAGVTARSTRITVDQIKPGMVGTGVTVFDGWRREEFTVRVIGVLENVIGPRRSLVLARLEGGPLAQTGVIAGMSGSPVYIDGRLAGAVSYSLGQFSKEPIAGITPIDEMLDAAGLDTPRPSAARTPLDFPLEQGSIAATLRQTYDRDRPFASRADEIRPLGDPGLAQLATTLRPIATPVSLAGFSGDARDLLERAFREAGFLPVAGGLLGGAAPEPPSAEPLTGGDPIGVSLVSGDLSLGATGTVTLVEGDRVYAFGHPFFNLGPTGFPMTRAYVHTVLPSLLSSSKLASLGDTIGTMQQDRATTIAGRLGRAPDTIPVSVSLDSDRGQKRSFSMRVASDQLFTPVLTFASVLSVLQSYEREFGAATFTITGETKIKGHRSVAIEDVFAGDSPSASAAMYVATPVNLLLRNDMAPVQIESVNLTIRSTEVPRIATLERVWIDEAPVRPGRTVKLKVLTRNYRGETTLRSIPIDIPSNATGTLTLLVSDGARLSQLETREWKQNLEPQSVDQLIRVFNTARKNNRLYVRLLSQSPGAVVNGEPLPSLPPSILSVYEADRSGGSFTPIRTSTIGEWDVPTDHAVRGSRLLTVTLDTD